MRVVAIGDVGVIDEMIHIGDEAMFEAFVDAMRARGLDSLVAVSANPSETIARYGADGFGIEAVRGIGFAPSAGGRAAQQDRLDRVLRTAAGETGLLADDDSALAVIDAIRGSDGVAVTGGGNLASTWPSHIFERLAIAGIAKALGKPFVVSGQTLGPQLSDEDSALVARLLGLAQLVSVRESASLAVAQSLDVPADRLRLGADDASFLFDETLPALPICVVTLANHVGDADRDAVTAAIADLLDEIVETTDLDIVFLAHFGSLDEARVRGDSVVHQRVMAQMISQRVLAVVPPDAPGAARIARSASLVVTSRYHPAVFAVPAGVPTIGIPVDEYTRVKLTGALENFGQRGILPVAALLAGDGPELLARVWADRVEMTTAGRTIADTQRAASAAWWDRVATVLSPRS
ncbi:polysaccharide pyruvyl transferase family protein [Frigoribacterium sp. UYMn621]|uniref:polysaccharide pyruvyl transferase family protein n=1 Tax=Frigoribacterium sp. UYMn621 TaxID=3156343 RepID=UPI00339B2C09